jgi:GxxExxY protein
MHDRKDGGNVPLEFECLTGDIIGAAIEVHRELGPGFLEKIYENALVLELRKRGLPHIQQWEVPVLYRELPVGTHVLDLFVGDQIVVEVKNVRNLEDAHFVVVRSYLRAVNRQHGLLLNFSRPTREVRRVIARGRDFCRSFGFVGSSETSS